MDALWQLTEARKRIPRWTTLRISRDDYSDLEDDDTPNRKGLVKRGAGGKKPVAALMDTAWESDDSMPGLLDVSNSSEDDDQDDSLSDYSDDEEEDDDDDDSDSEYDEDEKEELKRMHREAQNLANASPEMFEPEGKEKYATERKKNPFLKLLGNLRGRFSGFSLLSSHIDLTDRPNVPAEPYLEDD